MKNKKINVLVITKSSWSDTNALGNTLSNFFNNWNGFSFNNIYFQEEIADNKVCDNYLQFTEGQLSRKIFRNAEFGFEYSKDQIKELFRNPNYHNRVKNNKKIRNIAKKANNKFLYLLREGLWFAGLINNKKIDRFVNCISPDIIFAFAADPIYLQRIIRYAAAKSNAKLVLFFADDIFSYKEFKLSSYIYQFLLRKSIKKSVAQATKLYGASSKLCEEYREYFGKEIKPLYKGCSFEELKLDKTNSFPIKIVYAGNLYYGRDKILTKLADEIVRINESIEKINLEIYTTTTITNEIDKNLNRGNSSKIMGSLPYDDIKEVLNRADIVLHVESFDTNQIKTTRLSFSTKIIDCMQSGSCMMAIGPDSIASIDYLLGIDGVISITDPSKIGSELDKIVNDPDSLKLKTEKLGKFARENHDVFKMRYGLQKDFLKLCSENRTEVGA